VGRDTVDLGWDGHAMGDETMWQTIRWETMGGGGEGRRAEGRGGVEGMGRADLDGGE
jgi:hypothetical protein